ncbi:MAG: hypothetical protein IPK55_12125 [Streptococcus sp.]|nr:hypothetical protein [Streptococcus sp.]
MSRTAEEDTTSAEPLIPNNKIEEKKKDAPPKQSTMGEIFQFNTAIDKMFMTFGLLSAIITGLGMPSFVFLFKDLTSGFGIDPDNIDVIYDRKVLNFQKSSMLR